MRLLKFGGESSISEIADKAYEGLSPATRKKAVEALLRANPHLEALVRVRPGTILTVPNVPGIRPAPGRADQNPSDEITAFLTGALQDYQTRWADRHRILESELGEQKSLLKDKMLRRVADASPPISELIAQAEASLDEEWRVASDSRKRGEAAVEKLRSDLSGR